MLDRYQYRNGMARLGASVNVITTDGPAGRRGFTASAVCSVSDEPPTILLCVNRQAASNEVLKANGILCVNVLASRHLALSERFASSVADPAYRFGDQCDWTDLGTGAPALRDASAALDCRISDVREEGTHSVFFCRVEAISLSSESEGLIYFDRSYHPIAAVV